jgi:cytochrome c oxidase assembly protein subunit 15
VRRVPEVPTALIRALAVVTVIGQAGIAVTGAVVRVTGSGLGCPSWPECFPDSLVPAPHPEVAALNQWIEFGNRLLSVALVLAAGIAMLAVLTLRPRRRRLTWLAVAQPLGIVAQAVIGGFVVLSGLVWWSVAVHFLISMVFTWLAVQLVAAVSDGPGPARSLVPRPVRLFLVTATAVLAALLMAGTLVTAAGPHAGDAATPRLGIEVAQLAQLHADLLFGYLGLLIGLGFTLRAIGAPARVGRRYAAVVVAVLAQGALGGVQYALGVPEVLAALHVLGAALVTVAAAALWAGTTERPAAPGDPVVAPPGDAAPAAPEPVPASEPVLPETVRSAG